MRQSESSTPDVGGAIRTYHGRTIEELLPRIQAELGADAIILSRREGLTGGIAGFFQHPFVELDATIGGPRLDVYDEGLVPPTSALTSDYGPPAEAGFSNYSRESPPPGHPFSAHHTSTHPSSEHPSPEHPFSAHPSSEHPFSGVSSQPNSPAGHSEPGFFEPGQAPYPFRLTPEHARQEQSSSPEAYGARTPFYTREPLREGRDRGYVTEGLAALARASTPYASAPPGSIDLSALAAQGQRTNELPDPFAQMLEQAASAGLAPPAGRAPTPAPSAERPTSDVPGSSASRRRAQTKILDGLCALGASEQFARELLDAAAAHIRPLAPRAGLSETVRSALAERIPVAAPLPTAGAAIVFVGAGGVGKTSCCAALLSAYRKQSALSAGYATLLEPDGNGALRMLLSPQIRKPLPVSTSRSSRAIRNARSEGLLVLDTPPLAPGERAKIRKLANLLDELAPERVVIVLPVTLGAMATAQLLEALRPLGASSLALTHTEETDQIGVAVEAACKFGLAPDYLLRRARSGAWAIGRLDPSGLAAKLVR